MNGGAQATPGVGVVQTVVEVVDDVLVELLLVVCAEALTPTKAKPRQAAAMTGACLAVRSLMLTESTGGVAESLW